VTDALVGLADLPKADLHVHQEASRYLDIVLADREGRPPYDWAVWRRDLAARVPPGRERLGYIGSFHPVPLDLDADDDLFVARIAALLRDHARQNATYVEIRHGGEVVHRDGFMELFRLAEREVQAEHPRLRAEAIAIVFEPTLDDVDGYIDRCLEVEGLAGVDFLYAPYHEEVSWTERYRRAERIAEAGLGITAHAGELSPANIAAAARMPGLTRIGHGVHAATDPALMDLLVARGVTLEVAPTCNEYFGVLPAVPEHPLLTLVRAGVRVTLATDNPVQLSTDIGQEYARAAAIGLTYAELVQVTRNAIEASFTTPERKRELLEDVAGDQLA
jgi:adenosine deaminase